ncbi:menaquinol-cytochrome c reductase cytochrome b subunit [Acidithrix ferrooxidans]|uniref:Cytochrome bc1 complex cytochrome b subunit n=2 Tax=Acidithrix ferrooxidans TaxID=1280514 RepID=A0A0D8HMI5_9ACTN|nr:menaquinol-cytochrome c reductase cytochrome b subunit [Acidithrix ferrooxidans]
MKTEMDGMDRESIVAGLPEDSDMWTNKVRRKFYGKLPPEKLLPDRQPSYVSSWIYVFGILTVSALAVVALSGAILAVKGPSWWHGSSIGHYVNSLHMWSVELFFFFMIIHLWGKFFMASWRGKRSLTWITGMITFLASVGTAFTGYVSQQNFDSQWISTQGKDGLNAAGIGSFFNVLNFGQMLMWHIVLLPLIVLIIVAIHVVMVRLRGVVHPFPPKGAKDYPADDKPWTGKYRRYDILKEGTIAMTVVLVLTILFAVVFSSPDEAPITLQTWARSAPVDFVSTATSELAGTSISARYGYPYNNVPGSGQKLGPISFPSIFGVTIPVNPAQDFVLKPLATVTNDPTLASYLSTYNSAGASQDGKWVDAYTKALSKGTAAGGVVSVPSGQYGPVPYMMNSLLRLASSGGLDASLVAGTGFYGTDYTKPLLFLADGGYMAGIAQKQHLLGTQWGMMNETGNYPGQAWLWLYTFWYQISPFSTSGNADVLVWSIIIVLSLGMMLLPFIPGLRAIPEKVKLYRLIWRDYYREVESEKID